MPLSLPQTCANCRHLIPGDKFCGHAEPLLWTGYIPQPARVVCDLHEPKTDHDEDEEAGYGVGV